MSEQIKPKENSDWKTLHSRLDRWTIESRTQELNKIVESFQSQNPEAEAQLDKFLKWCNKDINKTRALTTLISTRDQSLSVEMEKLIIQWNVQKIKENFLAFAKGLDK